jgi:hypothetical protein
MKLKNASGKEAFYTETNERRTKRIERFCIKNDLIFCL